MRHSLQRKDPLLKSKSTCVREILRVTVSILNISLQITHYADSAKT